MSPKSKPKATEPAAPRSPTSAAARPPNRNRPAGKSRSSRASQKSSNAPAAPTELQSAGDGASATPPKRKRAKPRPRPRPKLPRVRLSEAFRIHGLDEHFVARKYVSLVDKLDNENESAGSAEKLLFDVLKENSRVLEPVRTLGAPGALIPSDAPVIVNLVHQVDRPVRPGGPPNAPPSDANESPAGTPAPEFSPQPR